MRRFASLLIIVALTACNHREAQPSQSEIIAAAVANPARPQGYRAADEFRKPADTLAPGGE